MLETRKKRIREMVNLNSLLKEFSLLSKVNLLFVPNKWYPARAEPKFLPKKLLLSYRSAAPPAHQEPFAQNLWNSHLTKVQSGWKVWAETWEILEFKQMRNWPSKNRPRKLMKPFSFPKWSLLCRKGSFLDIESNTGNSNFEPQFPIGLSQLQKCSISFEYLNQPTCIF